MPVRGLVAAVVGALLLTGCGRPIPSVRAGAQPEGEFLRVKSVQQAQAEDAHAVNLRREHAEALGSAQPNVPAGAGETPATASATAPLAPQGPEGSGNP